MLLTLRLILFKGFKTACSVVAVSTSLALEVEKWKHKVVICEVFVLHYLPG